MNTAVETPTITYADLFNAIEKNGYEQDFNYYVNNDPFTRVIKSACALGQGFLNLKAQYPDFIPHDAENFFENLNRHDDRWNFNVADSLVQWVIDRNDKDHWSIKMICEMGRVKFEDLLNIPIPFSENEEWNGL